MTIIEKYMPLNDKDKIRSLMEELKGISGAMNPATREQIFLNIKKTKLQIMFQDEYPESMFTDQGRLIPTIKSEEDTSTPTGSSWLNTTAVSQEQLVSITYLPLETLKEKKYVYGTYIEMAFHNFYLTMHHIYSLIFGEDLMAVAKSYFEQNNTNPDKQFDEDFAAEWALWTPMFKRFEDANPEQKERFEELVGKHFPFLKAMDALSERNRITKTKALEKFSYVLRELRNIYSHYHFCPNDNQVRKYKTNIGFVFELMDILYEGAQREVKTRFGFSEDKMQCARKYEQNRDRSLRDKFGKPVRIVPKKNFKYALCSLKEAEKTITPFGLVFLASLFLEKKYAKILSDKTHCIRYADQEVLCELISVYRIRLHIQKISVTKQTDALALDIINELQRCPKQLFEMIPSVEQQQFRIKQDSPQSPEVLMIRHQDRFAHLLLKYIDDTKLFDRIRFQVSLGRYFFRFYDKLCIDSSGNKRVRSICKDVHGFGRITEVETYRKSVYGDMVREYEDVHANTSEEAPYITDHHAQYLINNNKIGIYIRTDKDTQCLLPELTPEGVRNLVPTCWLSTYELPALAFLIHLYNGDGTRVEDIIRSQVADYQRLFADVRDGNLCPVADETELVKRLETYGSIKPSNLPRKMLDYLLMKDVCADEMFRQWAQSELQRMVMQTDRLLKRMEEELKLSSNIKQNKLGKKSFVAIKPGRIAGFLAHDMMFFQPNGEEGNNKLTGLNFRILQSSLAIYDGNFEELSRIMRNAHIIGCANDNLCNPIVMEVCRKYKSFRNLTDFYLAYLKARRSYLKDCLSKEDFTSVAFLHPSQNKWKERNQDYYRQLAARYLMDEYGGTESAKAIELPRGLFEPYIRKELSEMKELKAMATDPTKNISYLIYGYFKQVMEDDSQTFYDAKRCYQLFNVLYRKSPRDEKVYRHTGEIREMLMRNHQQSIRKDITTYLSRTMALERANEEERCNALLKKIKDTETELKRYRIQDMMLFLIAKRILLDKQAEDDSIVRMNAVNQIHLKDIADGNTLSKKISISVTITSQNGYSKVIKQDDLKLKNYSQFYSILNDRRLPSLLDLIQNRYIQRTDIEAELSNYDKYHPRVLEAVFGFEKHYIDTHPAYGDSHIPNIKEMLANSNMSENKRKEIRWIRNSFAHLTYPKHHVANAGAIDLPKKAETISNKLINHLNDENES